MAFARPDLAALLLLAAPALAKPAPLPTLELPAAAPLVEAELLGQRLKLRVDPGSDPFVILAPAAARRLAITAEDRPDGELASRGTLVVAVGQARVRIPFTRELLMIEGRPVRARVLLPESAPEGIGAADGVIGLPLLPHPRIVLRLRTPRADDKPVAIDGLFTTSSGALGFHWPAANGRLDVELHPDRPVSVASVAAASLIAAARGGHVEGPVRRVVISHGITRPVRTLQLDAPLRIGGAELQAMDVRLFDWAGRSELPPDTDAEQTLTVTGSRGRQRGWPILKLGADALGSCASLAWDQPLARVTLLCPAG